jgi:hypothetical protein
MTADHSNTSEARTGTGFFRLSPEKVMWHNNPYWDDASAKKDACNA